MERSWFRVFVFLLAVTIGLFAAATYFYWPTDAVQNDFKSVAEAPLALRRLTFVGLRF